MAEQGVGMMQEFNNKYEDEDDKQDLLMAVSTSRKSMHDNTKVSNNMSKSEMQGFLKDLQTKTSN